MYNLFGSYSHTQVFYKQLRLLRVEVLKWPKIKQLLSNAQAQITQIIPMFKQLEVETYISAINDLSCWIPKDWTQAHAEKKPEAESGLSKQLLGNFQTENSYNHKYSRLK